MSRHDCTIEKTASGPKGDQRIRWSCSCGSHGQWMIDGYQAWTGYYRHVDRAIKAAR